MNLLQALLLGVIQGLTEFIPVSSSAHLVLVPWALSWPAPSLAFDTMVHWGTLTAVLIYFRQDWLRLGRGLVRSVRPSRAGQGEASPRLADPDSRLAWMIIIATIPAAAAGYLFNDFFESLFNKPAAVGVFLLMTALILALGELFYRGARDLVRMRWSDAIIVGLAQAAAIAPGLSRSGLTIVAGTARGLTRDEAARFSFLISAPVIFGAGLLQLVDLVQTRHWVDALLPLAVGFFSAAIIGYLCMRFLLAYLRHGRLYPFAIYCAVVGAAALAASVLA